MRLPSHVYRPLHWLSRPQCFRTPCSALMCCHAAPPQPCACSGFTEALVELKQRIAAAHPTLPPENPGKRPGMQAAGLWMLPAAPLPWSGMPAAYADAFHISRC